MAELALKVRHISARYGAAQVLEDVSFDVPAGSAMAIFGANGAGKTSLLRIMSGLQPPIMMEGSVMFSDQSLSGRRAWEITRLGIAHVLEGRQIFGALTVHENLVMGSAARRLRRSELQERLQGVFDIFPRLHERRSQLGGSLSGGEQQMLAIGRALMSNPRVLLIDEPSLGLSPAMTAEVYSRLKILLSAGERSIVVVEESINNALTLVSSYLVLQRGVVVASGEASELRESESTLTQYLG